MTPLADGTCEARHRPEATPYRFWLDGRGYDRNIHIGDTIWRSVDYIHMNPVRRGLVARPEDWLWSSYRDWHNLGTSPIPVNKERLL